MILYFFVPHCSIVFRIPPSPFPKGAPPLTKPLSIVFTTPSVPLVGDRNLREEEETALLGAFFRKPTRPSLPLRKAPHLSPSLSLLRRERMCQPPYSVLKPLRYKVGGPSEVYASSGAAFFCAGMNPPSLKYLRRGCVLLRDSLDR